MKVWILQLFALWVWSVDHVMANGGANYTHPKPATRASGGGRKAGNGPSSLTIVGVSSNLCVKANRFVPLLVDCKAGAKDQQWDLYTDGTVRTEMNLDMCLTCNDLTQGSDILILPCSLSSKDFIVWKYRNSDHALVNAATDMVMDLRNAETTVPQQMLLWSSHSGDNQRWYLET